MLKPLKTNTMENLKETREAVIRELLASKEPIANSLQYVGCGFTAKIDNIALVEPGVEAIIADQDEFLTVNGEPVRICRRGEIKPELCILFETGHVLTFAALTESPNSVILGVDDEPMLFHKMTGTDFQQLIGHTVQCIDMVYEEDRLVVTNYIGGGKSTGPARKYTFTIKE